MDPTLISILKNNFETYTVLVQRMYIIKINIPLIKNGISRMKRGRTIPTYTEQSLTGMKHSELKEECRSRGLKVSGRKSELVERIIDNDKVVNEAVIVRGVSAVKIANTSITSISHVPKIPERISALTEIPHVTRVLKRSDGDLSGERKDESLFEVSSEVGKDESCFEQDVSLGAMKVVDLRDKCRGLGLKVSGTKKELISRIENPHDPDNKSFKKKSYSSPKTKSEYGDDVLSVPSPFKSKAILKKQSSVNMTNDETSRTSLGKISNGVHIPKHISKIPRNLQSNLHEMHKIPSSMPTDLHQSVPRNLPMKIPNSIPRNMPHVNIREAMTSTLTPKIRTNIPRSTSIQSRMPGNLPNNIRSMTGHVGNAKYGVRSHTKVPTTLHTAPIKNITTCSDLKCTLSLDFDNISPCCDICSSNNLWNCCRQRLCPEHYQKMFCSKCKKTVCQNTGQLIHEDCSTWRCNSPQCISEFKKCENCQVELCEHCFQSCIDCKGHNKKMFCNNCKTGRLKFKYSGYYCDEHTPTDIFDYTLSDIGIDMPLDIGIGNYSW